METTLKLNGMKNKSHNVSRQSKSDVENDEVWRQLIDKYKHISNTDTDECFHHKNDNLNGLYKDELPIQSKEISEARVIAWNNLFTKYNNTSDQDEIDLGMTKSEKEYQNNDDEENEQQDDDKCYKKTQAPIRKHPATIQYWIDTGESPHKLVDTEQSDTAGSISEDDNDNSKIDESLLINDKNKKIRDTSLGDSSVDTAAYILSNTNITKKAEAIAIIEDSKTPKKMKFNNENNEIKLCNGKGEKINDKNDNNKSFNELTNKKNVVNHSPMKITDVVMHLNRILSPTKRLVSQDDDSTEIFQLKKVDRTPNKSMKPFQRRKLYTGRNSPVDICTSSVEKQSRSLARTTNEIVVNQTPPTAIKKKNRVRKKRRISMKRKSSRLASINKNYLPEKNDFIKRLESSCMDDKKKILTNYQKEQKLENEKLQINNSHVEIFNQKSDKQINNHNEKLNNLKDLCLKKQLVICLKKIPDDIINNLKNEKTIKSDTQSIDLQKINNNKTTDVFDDKQSKVFIKPLLPDSKIINKTSRKSKKIEDLKNKNNKRKRRKVTAKIIEVKQINSDKTLADIKNIFNDESNNDDLTTDNIKKQLNSTKCLYSFCIGGSSSDDDSDTVPPVTRKTIFNEAPVTFSSDEEANFDTLVKKNKKRKHNI